MASDNSVEDAGVNASSEVRKLHRERFATLEEVGRFSEDLMLVVDSAGVVQYANPKSLETFGLSLEEGLGTSAFAYIHPDDLEHVITQFLALLETPSGTIRDTIRTIASGGETHE